MCKLTEGHSQTTFKWSLHVPIGYYSPRTSRWDTENAEEYSNCFILKNSIYMFYKLLVKVKLLSRVRLFATPWTVARQAPLSMGFARLLCPWDSPGKNTGMGCHFLLQGIFPTQESNPGLLHCRQTLYPLSHQGSHLQTISSVALICFHYSRK